MLRRHFIRECCNTLRIDSRLQKMRDALLLNLELLLISYLTHFFKSVREIYVSRRLRLFFCFCLFFFKFKDNNIKKQQLSQYYLPFLLDLDVYPCRRNSKLTKLKKRRRKIKIIKLLFALFSAFLFCFQAKNLQRKLFD